jgi:hypothetical protein
MNNGVLFRHQEEQNYVVWMELENFILSKVSQAQKNQKLHVFPHL